MHQYFFGLYVPVYLPLLGLDIHKPVIYEHSKKLLGNMVVLLACRDDSVAACEARLAQHDISVSSPSLLSLSGDAAEGHCNGRLGILGSRNGSSLALKAKQLISFIAVRYDHCTWIYNMFCCL